MVIIKIHNVFKLCLNLLITEKFYCFDYFKLWGVGRIIW